MLEMYLCRSSHVENRQLCHQRISSAIVFKDFNNSFLKKYFPNGLINFLHEKEHGKV